MSYRSWREFWALVAVAILTVVICSAAFWWHDPYRGKVPVNCRPVLEYQVCDWVKP